MGLSEEGELRMVARSIGDTRRGNSFRRVLLQVVTVWAMATVLVAVPVTPAHAACSPPIDQIAAMQRADSVFVGQVIELTDSSRIATVQVIEIWKGPDLDALVTVNGSLSGAPAVRVTDRTYLLGGTYLVVPFGSRSPFFDEACSATGLFVPRGGQIPLQFQDAVGATTARLPVTVAPVADTSEGSGGISRGLMLGGSMAALALLVLVRRRRRKPAMPIPADAEARPVSSPGTSPNRVEDLAPEPVRAALAVAAVARRRPRRRHRWPSAHGQRPRRLSKSGLANLETLRKKSRRAREKQRK